MLLLASLNKGMMAEPDADRFKGWPALLDRQQLKDVIGAGARAALEEKHPRLNRSRRGWRRVSRP
ncbi:hypothetical protein [Sorangium cellulosum]|uniref:hypothetical protein n=1 Tax=Sorangium cellulosum TaxID=56 RepID=UPI000A9A8C20|nr:hypothetical protein [Sorangium cellulosum]